MEYKVLTERDKKIRIIFDKLVSRALDDSGPLSSKVRGWAPDRGYKAGFRPGDLIKKLNEEDRKTISELTIDDMKNIDNRILQLINLEQQNANEKTFWKQMRIEFEEFLNGKKS